MPCGLFHSLDNGFSPCFYWCFEINFILDLALGHVLLCQYSLGILKFIKNKFTITEFLQMLSVLYTCVVISMSIYGRIVVNETYQTGLNKYTQTHTSQLYMLIYFDACGRERICVV